MLSVEGTSDHSVATGLPLGFQEKPGPVTSNRSWDMIENFCNPSSQEVETGA